MKPDGELAFQHTEDGLTIRVRVEVTYHRPEPSEPLSAEYGTAPLAFLSPQLKASVNSYFQACKAERQAQAELRKAVTAAQAEQVSEDEIQKIRQETRKEISSFAARPDTSRS